MEHLADEWVTILIRVGEIEKSEVGEIETSERKVKSARNSYCSIHEINN